MANHYTRLAFELALNEEAKLWMKIFFERWDSIEGPEGELRYMLSNGLIPDDEITAAINTISEEIGNSPAVTLTDTPSGLYVTSDESANLDLLISMLEIVQDQFDLPPIGFEWASVCDKPCTDAFGGGAVVITKEETIWINTGCWLYDKMRAVSESRPMPAVV